MFVVIVDEYFNVGLLVVCRFIMVVCCLVRFVCSI